jgi:hypothetical protein
MAKPNLGTKKVRLCNEIGGKPYTTCRPCYVHYVARCWFTEDDADWVDYRNRIVVPAVRAGVVINLFPMGMNSNSIYKSEELKKKLGLKREGDGVKGYWRQEGFA